MKLLLVALIACCQICLAEVSFAVYGCDFEGDETLLTSTLTKNSDARLTDILLADIDGDERCEIIVVSQTEDNVWFSIYRLDGTETKELTLPQLETVNDIAPGISSLYVTKNGLFMPYAKLKGEITKGLYMYMNRESSIETELGAELINLGEVIFQSVSP